MAKDILVAVSFGTTYDGTRKKNIEALEEHLAKAFPEWEVQRAFTSNMVRARLAKKGVLVDDLPALLEKAKQAKAGKIALLPTHLIYGEEYEKMCAQAEGFRQDFTRLAIGKPLLASTHDNLRVAKIFADLYPPEKEQCVILMGHGTRHYVNPVYAGLDYIFRDLGRDDILVGTVEAYPGIEQVLVQVKEKGYKKATLAPLMLVAGDHAQNDLAGEDEDSWKSILQAAGIEVDVVLRGLGEYPEILELYEEHGRELVDTLL